MSEDKFKSDPKKRFSSRVANYVKYRPKYPQEIISFLSEQNILNKKFNIADIGSGTGILSELFLRNGNFVYGVEPNKEMRVAGEIFLKSYSKYVSIEGSAEDTTLSDESVSLITAGQSFHWFNIERSRKEFLRILKPESWVILIWNRRKKETDEFLQNHEKLLLKYGTDYKFIEKRKLDFDKFFKGELNIQYKKILFANHQIVNYEELEGRLLSASYIPLNDHPLFNDMILELKKLFIKYQENGLIKILYETEVYYGQLI